MSLSIKLRSALPDTLGFVPHLLLFLLISFLTWFVHDAPFAPNALHGWVRIDAPGTVFALLALLSAVIARLREKRRSWRTLLAAAALTLAYSTAQLGAIWLGFAIATALLWQRSSASSWSATRQIVGAVLPLAAFGAAILALFIQAGIWRYDVRLAAASLNSLIFSLTLLAAIGGWLVDARLWGIPTETHSGNRLMLGMAWFYPLFRLYSFGPWNLGWLFATLLLGGATALWFAWQSFATADASARAETLAQVQLGLALAGVGLGSSAGLTASIFALFVALMLDLGLQPQSAAVPVVSAPRWPIWLLSGVIPLTAPFVSAWMGVGAAATEGMLALAGGLWLAALLAAAGALKIAATGDAKIARRRITLAAGCSVALGITSPGIVRLLIEPLTRQLQGGLTPFGTITLWPWSGLLALNSASQPTATLPSFALAGLMLILGALAYLAARIPAVVREMRQASDDKGVRRG